MQKNHLAARFRSDPLGELTLLPIPPSWIQREGMGRWEQMRQGMERGGEKKGRKEKGKGHEKGGDREARGGA